MSLKSKIEELRRIATLHKVWLSYALLGKEAISSKEFEDLKKYGKLPLDTSLNLVKNSYILGRLSLLLKKAEYKDLALDDVVEQAESAKLTSLEKFAIEHAIFGAAEGIKGLGDDIVRGAFAELSNTLETSVTEASIRNIIRDETAIAILQKKSANKLASTLVSKLQTDWRRPWKRVAETELHKAKTLGAAQTIINKVGMFEGSEGVNSKVSIVPNPDRCEDCSKHYLDKNGNPKTFTLKDLLDAGSNAGPGVSHKRDADGTHAGWNSTLPPLHPTCGCRLVYIPDGMEWKSGKLVVVDNEAFSKGLRSFVGKVLGGEQKNPGSIPGVAAPGNVAGPGRPASMPGIEYNYIPVEEGKPEGSVGMTESGQSYKVPVGLSTKGPLTEEDKKLMTQAKVQSATAWGKSPKPDSVILGHLSTGKITTIKSLNEDDTEHSGINESYRVTIEENGRGLAKPAVTRDKPAMQGLTFGAGLGSIPVGTEHTREVASYQLSSALGINVVPPTTHKEVKGKQMSMQHWKEDTAGVTSEAIKTRENTSELQDILHSTPLAKKAHMENKLKEIAVLDIVQNSNDRHLDNLVFSKGIEDVHAIDNGWSFGTGLSGHRGDIHNHFHVLRKPLKIPDKMKERMDNMSLGDYKRSLKTSGLEDWAIGQTFLRSRYASFLQETEGHLDFEKFRPTLNNMHGEPIPFPEVWKQRAKIPEGVDNPAEHLKREYINTIANHKHSDMIDNMVTSKTITMTGAMEFINREKEGNLPSQMFESWSKNYIANTSQNPGHRDYGSAKEISELGVFMGEGFAKGPTKYRQTGQHKAHENSVKAKNPPKQVGKSSPLAYGIPQKTQEIGLADTQLVSLPEASEAVTPVMRGKKKA